MSTKVIAIGPRRPTAVDQLPLLHSQAAVPWQLQPQKSCASTAGIAVWAAAPSCQEAVAATAWAAVWDALPSCWGDAEAAGTAVAAAALSSWQLLLLNCSCRARNLLHCSATGDAMSSQYFFPGKFTTVHHVARCNTAVVTMKIRFWNAIFCLIELTSWTFKEQILSWWFLFSLYFWI